MDKLFIPDNYDDLLRWLKSYNQGKQILQATGMDNIINEEFLAKVNKAHTGFIFLSLDPKGLTKGEFIIDDKPNNRVSVRRISIKDIISIECSLSNYGVDFYGYQFQHVQYSLSLRNETSINLKSEDYATDSNLKFMEVGKHLMSRIG